MKYLLSIRPVIIIIFLLSLIYIFCYNFYFEECLTKNNYNLTIFKIIEKITFSLVATIIFYIINQHYPREKKKEKTLKQLKTSIGSLKTDIINLLQSLHIECSYNDYFEKDLKILDDRLNTEIIQGKGSTALKYQISVYITLIMNRLSDEVEDILVFHDTINEDVLEKLLFLKRRVDERKKDKIFEQIELPLSWETPTLIIVSKTLEEISKMISSKDKN